MVASNGWRRRQLLGTMPAHGYSSFVSEGEKGYERGDDTPSVLYYRPSLFTLCIGTSCERGCSPGNVPKCFKRANASIEVLRVSLFFLECNCRLFPSAFHCGLPVTLFFLLLYLHPCSLPSLSELVGIIFGRCKLRIECTTGNRIQ